MPLQNCWIKDAVATRSDRGCQGHSGQLQSTSRVLDDFEAALFSNKCWLVRSTGSKLYSRLCFEQPKECTSRVFTKSQSFSSVQQPEVQWGSAGWMANKGAFESCLGQLQKFEADDWQFGSICPTLKCCCCAGNFVLTIPLTVRKNSNILHSYREASLSHELLANHAQ